MLRHFGNTDITSQSFNKTTCGLDIDIAQLRWGCCDVGESSDAAFQHCQNRIGAATKGERGHLSETSKLRNTHLKDVWMKRAEEKRQSRCELGVVAAQLWRSTTTTVIRATDSPLPIAKHHHFKMCHPALISELMTTVPFSHDKKTSAERQAFHSTSLQDLCSLLVTHLSLSHFLLLVQPLVFSSPLSSPSTFSSISSRKPRVLAKVRDVFSPTTSCSCVSCVLYHSSSWDPLGSVLAGEALVVCRGGSLLSL